MQILIQTVKKLFLAAAAVSILSMVTFAATADTVLITGSNRGIGLEFAKEYAAKGWNVIATHRRDTIPDTLKVLSGKYPNVRVERMDVSKLSEIDALAAKLKGVPIDVLINNAGIAELGKFKGIGNNTRQAFGTLNYDDYEIMDKVNVRGPIKVAEAFYPNVKASKQKKIISISSAAGMVSTPQRGGMYWYGMNKAALNKLMVTLAADVKKDGVSVAMFHPGGVKVEKFANYNYPGMISPHESVSGMIKVIAGLTLDKTGRFWSHDGKTMPW